jgi:hypothetical protein
MKELTPFLGPRKMAKKEKKIKITLVRSPIGNTEWH